ncbi:MAG: hypothetical protein JWM32_273 [Verrucomicrobia bacterium]|nr:hypothetical protein [Verrucomicrobiota bacterium]
MWSPRLVRKIAQAARLLGGWEFIVAASVNPGRGDGRTLAVTSPSPDQSRQSRRIRRTLLVAAITAAILPPAFARAADLPAIAVFAGPTATILNTDPARTSQKARDQHGLPPLVDWFGRRVAQDTLYPQRLAAPVTVYVEQFSAHPLERDAAALFAAPDGYLDAKNVFHRDRSGPGDRAVYEIVLRPEDGLYPLPYMARRADGSAWEGAEGSGGGFRQTLFPDASRLFEEIERMGSVLNGNLSGRARFSFFRAAPPAGYLQGLPAAQRTDAGVGAIPAEKAGADFYPYGYANSYPPRAVLAQITNAVEETLAAGNFRGALWLEGSPRVEDTVYWLNLVIDTDRLIVGAAAQRPNHRLSADGPQTVVDAVDLILSDVWRDTAGHNRTGAVLVEDQQVFAAREVVKTAARPGGFATTGGHGGLIGSTIGPTLTFLPTRRFGHASEVRFTQLPDHVAGVLINGEGRWANQSVAVKDPGGKLRGEAIPQVEAVDLSDWMTGTTGPNAKAAQRLVQDALARCVADSPLVGLVAESVQGGHFDQVEVEALNQAALQGVPVVKVFRGANAGFVYPDPGNLFIEGSNLNSSKARVLLMACLLRYGSLPIPLDAKQPTPAELEKIRAQLALYQAVFDTH